MFAPTCFSDHAVRKVDIELLFFFPSHLLPVELLPKPNDFCSIFPFFSHFFLQIFRGVGFFFRDIHVPEIQLRELSEKTPEKKPVCSVGTHILKHLFPHVFSTFTVSLSVAQVVGDILDREKIFSQNIFFKNACRVNTQFQLTLFFAWRKLISTD